MKRLELPAILALWAAAVAASNPRGRFPLNDDWDFAIATWNFARTGHFAFTKFTAVSLRAQVLWGALWTRLFGESFEVLRASTLVLALLAIILVHRILARAGVTPWWRVAATLAFAFHPIAFWSSMTYMTEVPFVCASAAALYCFVRGFDESRTRWIVAGCIAVAVSAFVRQTGVINLAAPFVLAAMRRRWRDAGAIAATALAFAALLLFKPEWVSGSPDELAVHYRVWHELSFRLPQQLELAYHWFVFNAQNCALFMLPLAAGAAFGRWTRRELLIAGGAALLLFLRVQSLVSLGHPMPYATTTFCCDIYGGNILADFGLGPQTLRGEYPLRLTGAARLLLTYASVLLGAVMVGALARRAAPGASSARWLAVGNALAATAALVASALYVDRYAFDSAWMLVVALAVVIDQRSRAARAAAVAALVCLAWLDVAGVRDYFDWNRARWQAFHAMRARGVAMTDIDGGAEIFDFYELSHGDQRMRRINQFGIPRRYTLAYAPLPGQRVVATFPWRRGRIVVNERQ